METQIVKGLGETLVGALPGRAMSFIPKRSNLDSPTLVVDKEEKMHSDSCPLLPEQSNNFVANPTKKPRYE
ncbi:hypothetical protein ACE6H2_005475 [Prunus campanulata]